ncbi:MAG TPA: hypothetical protein VE981_17360 [Planctomycetota bacterium]|nr:hypothetical protein [Planctomycetota bacterium]
MGKRFLSGVAWLFVGILSVSMVSCSGGAAAPAEAPARKQVTYKCLVSSCDATVTTDEGAPVPEHHGKPMIH